MSSQNNVRLIGFLTKKPRQDKTRKMQVPVTTFTLAVRRDYKMADGTRLVDFIRVVAWNRSAVYCGENLDKGDMVAVDGQIRTHRFHDANGIERDSFEIHVNDVNLLRHKNHPTNRSTETDEVTETQDDDLKLSEEDLLDIDLAQIDD